MSFIRKMSYTSLKSPATRAAAPAREVSETPSNEASRSSSKRPFDGSAPQSSDPTWKQKKVKVLSKRHKSRRDEGGSRSHSRGKEPSRSVEELEAPEESAEDIMHRSSIDTLKLGGVPEAVATAEEWAIELEKELERIKHERDEHSNGSRLPTKNLTKPELMKELESVRAELSRWAIDNYKGSADLKEGLKRMGHVSYEYEYHVALAHFRALHPDSEVEEKPFTI
ncbi:hypothetical protein B296_00020796 [Ensete ventricosum]|uniref:Uncharacterized protein n=1 Tax=Ensete ventricosum TaxID=4639 RepID=A0A427AYR7_ENSVE|nr:hypothetical protein B296_00020796 [Ensete ventricosum]